MLKKLGMASLAIAAAVTLSACEPLDNSSTATGTAGVETRSIKENVLPTEGSKNSDKYGMLTEDQKATVFKGVLKDGGIAPVSGTTWNDYIELAESMCGALDNGATLVEVFDILLDGPIFTPEQAGTFAGSSIAVYCPEHESLIGE